MIMRATERDAEELKVRAVVAAVRARPRVGRRGVKDGIVVSYGELVDRCCGLVWMDGGMG